MWFMTSFLHFRNHLLTGILKLCKENMGRVPKIVGMDVVEMALWAQVFVLIRHAACRTQLLEETAEISALTFSLAFVHFRDELVLV